MSVIWDPDIDEAVAREGCPAMQNCIHYRTAGFELKFLLRGGRISNSDVRLKLGYNVLLM
jgi:hypothetical protein